MSAADQGLSDIGPAVPAPGWSLPDVEPSWEKLTERFGGGTVCCWQRKMSDDVWLECEDRIVDGRVMRSAARIQYFEPTADGIGCVQARELAAALVEAADVNACAAMDEAGR